MNIIDVESPNFSVYHDTKTGHELPVLTKKSAIVLHDTGGKTAKGTIAWFINPDSKVSSHFVIDKDGVIYRMVPEEYVAWHAGRSVLHGEDNVNNFSLGVEIVDDNDSDAYPDAQMAALLDLCASLCLRYKIPINRVIGHQHICIPRGRKIDPGKDFPWYDFLNTLGATISEGELAESSG